MRYLQSIYLFTILSFLLPLLPCAGERAPFLFAQDHLLGRPKRSSQQAAARNTFNPDSPYRPALTSGSPRERVRNSCEGWQVPRQPCGLEGCWGVGGGLLYWKPFVCSWDYAEVVSTEDVEREGITESVTTRSLFSLHPSMAWGARAFATLAPCAYPGFFLFEWNQIWGSTKDALSSDAEVTLLFSGQPYTGVRVSQNIQFEQFYLWGSFYLLRCAEAECYFYGGGRYAYLEVRQKIWGYDATDLPLLVQEKSSFSGGGFSVGIGGRTPSYACFSLAGRFGLLAMIGAKEYKFTTAQLADATPGSVLINEEVIARPGATEVIPGVELRLAIRHNSRCQHLCWFLELAYEMNHYFGAIFNSSEETSQGAGCENMGAAGPSLSLGFSF